MTKAGTFLINMSGKYIGHAIRAKYTNFGKQGIAHAIKQNVILNGRSSLYSNYSKYSTQIRSLVPCVDAIGLLTRNYKNNTSTTLRPTKLLDPEQSLLLTVLQHREAWKTLPRKETSYIPREKRRSVCRLTEPNIMSLLYNNLQQDCAALIAHSCFVNNIQRHWMFA